MSKKLVSILEMKEDTVYTNVRTWKFYKIIEGQLVFKTLDGVFVPSLGNFYINERIYKEHKEKKTYKTYKHYFLFNDVFRFSSETFETWEEFNNDDLHRKLIKTVTVFEGEI